MSKPIYVGMTILDLAKMPLYSFHYEHMLKEHPKENVKICYMDTDSLIYDVKCDDIYEEIKKHSDLFDTSNYPENNQFNIQLKNKKVVGKWKDENAGRIMTAFCGLRSKQYATQVEGVDADKKAKGVKRCVVKNKLTFEDYKNTCLNKTVKTVQQCLIQSSKHNVYTVLQSKTALSHNDTKRYIIEDGTNETYAWGHYRIESDT